jgi:hypothetical protein
MKKVIIHNLPVIPKNADIYFNMSSGFSKQLEIRKQVKAFCELPGIKTVWLSRKRVSTTKAIKEFKALYEPKNFYAMFDELDDTFEMFYMPRTVV